MNDDALRSEGDLNISPLREAWMREHIGEETRRWLAEDERYFLRQSLSTPCLNVLRACDGAYIEDLEGRRYLDFHGNNVHQVGFGNRRVIEAIKAQLDALSFCTRRYTNMPAIALARRLAELAPNPPGKVLFAPGGAAVIGMALKLARMATGRHKTISLWDSFHGASLDAISIGGEAIFRKDAGPLLPGTEHVPPPDPAHCPFCRDEGRCNLKCADYIEYVLEKEGDVAAVIAETVRSTPFIPPKAYWERVRAACDRHGALLILDEIPTCLGRTGKMFACEHYGIVPDMLCIGKGLGGGIFPLAALIAREGLDIAPDRAIGHYTHEKNPVACAAGLATLDCLIEDGLIDRAAAIGGYAIERLRELQARHAIIGDVRGLGLLIGVELTANRGLRSRASAEAEWIMYRALEKGLSFKITMGNILTLTPPLTVAPSQVDDAIAILDACFADLASR
ncbi:MAG TPA: aspartate aminotransferase family protein [Candidatus Hydrogenedentes bacterium]|mgnify:CR=1 FL=1|nr:aspartate aminotransferase family protein [Candidatus Hydrogenedentota bacterium]HOV72883.1 aspartate aminotransferase family protein [Candidatus Hydrogenedentota bacterium]HPC16420.1 aspartate aminotransferase family protein [Candidatus Hydrogenedentota bacterium]HRT20353.1 aspartate aminotransferase family protein [Candidatus Hydrogenedentota bacterium]HRT65079.1 aspartate aminotransferase family protein [Candidatus Hydrogenedentota bacterium]